jgi:predicted amidophosphoribosyltransferase
MFDFFIKGGPLFYGIKDSALKFLFPPRCVFCGNVMVVDSDIDICKECYSRIPFAGRSIITPQADATDGRGCDYVICVCRYSGIIRDSLIRFKFFNKTSYYRALAGLLPAV